MKAFANRLNFPGGSGSCHHGSSPFKIAPELCFEVFARQPTQFSRNAKHASPKWPGGYWPEEEAPPSASAWEKSVQAFHADLKAMQNLVADSNTDLYAPIAWGEGQTILREALLVADHNAYHLGQLVLLRRLLGAWGE